MTQYHKIKTVFKRPPGAGAKKSKVVEGLWSDAVYQYLQNNDWVWTEKIDGTNIRVVWNADTGDLQFAGKTDAAKIPSHLLARLAKLFPKENFKNLPSMILYGEGFGDKIQSGGKYLGKGHVDFALFDIRLGMQWLKREDIEDIGKKLGSTIAPVVGFGPLCDAIELIQEQTLTSQWGPFLAEGKSLFNASRTRLE